MLREIKTMSIAVHFHYKYRSCNWAPLYIINYSGHYRWFSFDFCQIASKTRPYTAFYGPESTSITHRPTHSILFLKLITIFPESPLFFSRSRKNSFVEKSGFNHRRMGQKLFFEKMPRIIFLRRDYFIQADLSYSDEIIILRWDYLTWDYLTRAG